MRCTRCVYDQESVPGLSLDADGVCQYCHMTDSLVEQYQTDMVGGYQMLNSIVETIKKKGKGKKYDCIVGFSGGVDSSFMLDWAVQKGLRPLAVNYDNGWGKGLADRNMEKVTKRLNVDFVKYIPAKAEVNDIFMSFMNSGTGDLDSSSDIALAEVLYRYASKWGVKYILEGHSFMTEGVSPLTTLYMDGAYIKSVHDKFGSIQLKTFPNMNLWHFLKWTAVKKIHKIRPYWYMGHSRDEAKKHLQSKFDWESYTGHHCENIMTEFHHNYWVYKKTGFDARANSMSAQVRSGQLDREEAIKTLSTPPVTPKETMDYVMKELNLTEKTLEYYIRSPLKTYEDYRTYKQTFKRLKPLFYILAKSNLVPMSFYIKYCKE